MLSSEHLNAMSIQEVFLQCSERVCLLSMMFHAENNSNQKLIGDCIYNMTTDFVPVLISFGPVTLNLSRMRP